MGEYIHLEKAGNYFSTQLEAKMLPTHTAANYKIQ